MKTVKSIRHNITIIALLCVCSTANARNSLDEPTSCAAFQQMVENMNSRYGTVQSTGDEIKTKVDCLDRTFTYEWVLSGRRTPAFDMPKNLISLIERTICEDRTGWRPAFQQGWKVRAVLSNTEGRVFYTGEILNCRE